MSIAKAVGLTLLICLGATSSAGVWQQADKPLSKNEIVAMLKQTGPRQISQGDIAEIVERRGVSFVLDDKTEDELRALGARSFLIGAIRHAIEDAARPKMEAPHEPALRQPGDKGADESRPEVPRGPLPLLEEAALHALDFSNELPNFVVTQMVSRYTEGPRSKDWELEDKLEIELTYRVGKGEQHTLLRRNGAPSNVAYDNLGGAISSGEFGAILALVFSSSSQAEFREIKHDKLHGRDSIIYDFKVKKANSGSHITDRSSGRSIITALKGSVWIDTETKCVLRIETSSEGIPESFPISMAEDSVEYDWVKIGDERALVPIRAEILMGDRGRDYSRNVIEFRNYHKFEGTIKVVPN